jgi:hypothetical protein
VVAALKQLAQQTGVGVEEEKAQAVLAAALLMQQKTKEGKGRGGALQFLQRLRRTPPSPCISHTHS